MNAGSADVFWRGEEERWGSRAALGPGVVDRILKAVAMTPCAPVGVPALKSCYPPRSPYPICCMFEAESWLYIIHTSHRSYRHSSQCLVIVSRILSRNHREFCGRDGWSIALQDTEDDGTVTSRPKWQNPCENLATKKRRERYPCK